MVIYSINFTKLMTYSLTESKQDENVKFNSLMEENIEE